MPAPLERAHPDSWSHPVARQSRPAWHSGARRGNGTPRPTPPPRSWSLPSGPSPLGWRGNPCPMGIGSPHPLAPNPVSCGFHPEVARALLRRRVQDGKTLHILPSSRRGSDNSLCSDPLPKDAGGPGAYRRWCWPWCWRWRGCERRERRGRRLELQSANAAVSGRGGS